MLRNLFRRTPAATRPAEVPPGAAVYAIGDIHGWLDLLEELLRQVAEDAAEYASLEPRQVAAKLKQLEAQMYQHARDLEFEKAAAVRDEILKLRELGLANPL